MVINYVVVQIISYADSLNWHLSELAIIDSKATRIMVAFSAHHSEANREISHEITEVMSRQ